MRPGQLASVGEPTALSNLSEILAHLLLGFIHSRTSKEWQAGAPALQFIRRGNYASEAAYDARNDPGRSRIFGERAELQVGRHYVPGIRCQKAAISSPRQPCASALVAGRAQSFHLSAQHGNSCSNAFVFLRGPCDFPVDRALVDKALKLFIGTQTQHLFAATGCVSLAQIEEHNSNKGLNSKEAFDESTAISSSVMLSGPRRVKEIADRFDNLRVSHRSWK